MPPQGLSPNKYGIDSGVTAPQTRNYAFLGHISDKIFVLFIHFLFTRCLARLSFSVFFWGGGVNDMLAPHLGFRAHDRIARSPPGTAIAPGRRWRWRRGHQTTTTMSSNNGGKDIPRSKLDIPSHFKFGQSEVQGCHSIGCGCNDGLMTASGAAHFRSEISTRRFHILTKSEQLLNREYKCNRAA